MLQILNDYNYSDILEHFKKKVAPLVCQNQVMCTAESSNFFLQARVARLQVLRLFWWPRDLCLYIYIYVCPHLKIIMPFIHVVLEECTP